MQCAKGHATTEMVPWGYQATKCPTCERVVSTVTLSEVPPPTYQEPAELRVRLAYIGVGLLMIVVGVGIFADAYDGDSSGYLMAGLSLILVGIIPCLMGIFMVKD
jgi:hypothetical protein